MAAIVAAIAGADLAVRRATVVAILPEVIPPAEAAIPAEAGTTDFAVK